MLSARRGRIKTYTEGGKYIYFPPICTVLGGKNIILNKGGGGKNMIFGKYIPVFLRTHIYETWYLLFGRLKNFSRIFQFEFLFKATVKQLQARVYIRKYTSMHKQKSNDHMIKDK